MVAKARGGDVRAAAPRSRRVAESTQSYRAAPSLWRASTSPTRTDALLLDTHAWIWTLEGELGKMSDAALVHIEVAACERRLFVSDVSFWEVSLKASKGQLALAAPLALWFEKAIRAPGIQGLAITRDVLIQSTSLAGKPHADPADRMLIAQAQLSNMSLLTCDARIIAYAGRQPGVPVCDARR